MPKLNHILLFIAVIFFDQTTKIIFAANIFFGYNKGISWGIPLNELTSLLIFPLFIIGTIGVFMVRPFIINNGFVVIIAAGFSNYIDRLVFGGIRDFIAVGSILPVFNFADVFIVLSVLKLIYGHSTDNYFRR